jgi:regulator of sirC expression with transglutaminase-like and TPR domain
LQIRATIAGALLLVAGGPAFAETAVQTVRGVLAAPEARIDYARAKLTLDKLVDPKTDVEGTLRDIDGMVAVVRSMAPPGASDVEKLRAVRRYLYVDGPWNGQSPYGYDFRDFFGHSTQTKLLADYLATRLGDCVSMPTLFLILADRLGLRVTLSTAPGHEFLKYTDPATGRSYDFEATSGGHQVTDDFYRSSFSMSDEAVANGVYLKTLDRRQTVALMADTVLRDALNKGRYREAIELADVLLKVYPAQALFLVQRGEGYEGLIYERFQRKYPKGDVPLPLVPELIALRRNADAAFDRVEALGVRKSDGLRAGAKEQPLIARSANVISDKGKGK